MDAEYVFVQTLYLQIVNVKVCKYKNPVFSARCKRDTKKVSHDSAEY